MQTEKLTHPTVKAAIDALQQSDTIAWFALFTKDAERYDDDNKKNFIPIKFHLNRLDIGQAN